MRIVAVISETQLLEFSAKGSTNIDIKCADSSILKNVSRLSSAHNARSTLLLDDVDRNNFKASFMIVEV